MGSDAGDQVCAQSLEDLAAGYNKRVQLLRRSATAETIPRFSPTDFLNLVRLAGC